MNRTLFIVPLVFTLLPVVGFSQNLIPNGDFELGPDSSSAEWYYWADSTCTYADTVLGPNFWTVLFESPDRLVEGDICPAWDNDTACLGQAYINIGTIGAGMYEAGKALLIFPMEKDSFYHLTYYTNFQNNCGGTQARLAFVFNNGGDSILSPWITFDNWQYCDTIFKASANSTEITITGAGNNTSCTQIDNVSLVKVTGTFFSQKILKNSEIKIYPNPSLGYLHFIGDNILSIQIYNLYGQEMSFSFIKKNDTFFLNLTDLMKEVYFIQIKKSNELITSKILLTN